MTDRVHRHWLADNGDTQIAIDRMEGAYKHEATLTVEQCTALLALLEAYRLDVAALEDEVSRLRHREIHEARHPTLSVRGG